MKIARGEIQDPLDFGVGGGGQHCGPAGLMTSQIPDIQRSRFEPEALGRAARWLTRSKGKNNGGLVAEIVRRPAERAFHPFISQLFQNRRAARRQEAAP
jgi:hypothetical protein